MIAPLPIDEAGRLNALRSFHILDTPPEPEFDDLARLASILCDTPIALVSLVDASRQWFKARIGVDATETIRDIAFCAHAILRNDLFEVPDALEDPRFRDNPLVTGEPRIRFYAGVPLTAPGGHNLGTLCAIDRIPRKLSPSQREAMSILARHVVSHIVSQRQVERLAATEDRLCLALEAARMGTWEWEIGTQRLTWDDREEEIFGFAPGTFDSRLTTFIDRVHPDDRSGVNEILGAAERQGQGFEGEFRILLPPGEIRWIHGRGQVDPGSSGRPRRMLGINFDVTDRVSAEAALRQQKAHLRAVVETAMDCVITIDREGRVIEFNPAAERTFGYTRAEMLGQELTGLIIPRVHREAHQNGILRYLSSGKSRVLGQRLVGLPALRKDGTEFPAELTIQAMQIDGEPVFTAFLRDVTEVKRAEREQQEAIAQQQAALAEVEAANRAKTHFLANISHEFRTPMSAIVGYSNMLLDPRLSVDHQTEYLQSIRRNGEHLLRLINDMLDLSKIEAGGMTLERVPSRLWRMIEEAMAVAEVTALEKHLQLQATAIGRLPRTITTDPTRLRQILMNLLDNAVKFTERGKKVDLRVSVSTAPGQPMLVLEVDDQGRGMTAEEIGRLFKPFVQADASTTRKYGGTGLGLSICKRLAESFGGSINVRSTPGIGSCFTVMLPLEPTDLDDMADGDELAVESQLRLPSTAPAKKLTGRILLADDNPDNRNIVRYLLERAGLSVLEAENGRVAVEKTTAGGIDLVLMDMQMPELDGYAATSMLRHKGYDRAIIALTAHAMAGDEEKCLRAGCNAYLTKPVDADQLISVVSKQLRSKSWVVKISDLHRKPAASPHAPPRSGVYKPHDSRLEDLLARYRSELPKKVAELKSDLDRGDLPSLSGLAHSFKGSAGMYGFPALSETLGLLESACNEGQERSLLQELIDEISDLVTSYLAPQ